MTRTAVRDSLWAGIAVTWVAWAVTFVPSYIAVVGYSNGISESQEAERTMAFIVGFGFVLFVTAGAASALLHLLGFRRAAETGVALFFCQLVWGALTPVLLYAVVFSFPLVPVVARVIACRVQKSFA